MGRQIIRQLDGLFAIFCSSTDMIIMWDATEEDIVEWFVEREVRRTTERVTRLVGLVAAGRAGEAYYQFARSWDDALAMDRERGGEASAVFDHLDNTVG